MPSMIFMGLITRHKNVAQWDVALIELQKTYNTQLCTYIWKYMYPYLYVCMCSYNSIVPAIVELAVSYYVRKTYEDYIFFDFYFWGHFSDVLSVHIFTASA